MDKKKECFEVRSVFDLLSIGIDSNERDVLIKFGFDIKAHFNLFRLCTLGVVEKTKDIGFLASGDVIITSPLPKKYNLLDITYFKKSTIKVLRKVEILPGLVVLPLVVASLGNYYHAKQDNSIENIGIKNDGLLNKITMLILKDNNISVHRKYECGDNNFLCNANWWKGEMIDEAIEIIYAYEKEIENILSVHAHEENLQEYIAQSDSLSYMIFDW